MAGKREPRPPALPATVWSALGPIRVEVVENLRDDKGARLMGCWDPASRVIQLHAGMEPVAALQCLHHEWVHAILSDAGTHLADVDEERVADAVATALTADLISHGDVSVRARSGKRHG